MDFPPKNKKVVQDRRKVLRVEATQPSYDRFNSLAQAKNIDETTSEFAGSETGQRSFKRIRKSQEEILETRRAALKRKHRLWLDKEPFKFNRVFSQVKELFPEAFSEYRPLAIGMYKEVRKTCDISGRDLHFFFNRYCQSIQYLDSVLKNTHRINIKGEEVSAITKIEHLCAHKQLECIKKRLEFEKEQVNREYGYENGSVL